MFYLLDCERFADCPPRGQIRQGCRASARVYDGSRKPPERRLSLHVDCIAKRRSPALSEDCLPEYVGGFVACEESDDRCYFLTCSQATSWNT